MSTTRNPALLTQQLDGELVLYDPNRDVVHNLNATARLVWEHCDGELDLDGLIMEITDRYGVSSERARRDVEHLLKQFQDLGLTSQDEFS